MKLRPNATKAEREKFKKKLHLKLNVLLEKWQKLFDETYEREVYQEEFDELQNEIEKIKTGILLISFDK